MTYRMSTIERIADTSRLAPGYLFTSPFPRSTRGVENIWIGPHIMDSDGVHGDLHLSHTITTDIIAGACLVGKCFYIISYTRSPAM
jgi:hypothetical protein